MPELEGVEHISGNGLQELQPVATRPLPPLPLADRILSLLGKASEPMEPKHIALRLNENHNTIKSMLRRLAQKNLVVRETSGYALPSTSIEREIDSAVRKDEEKEALPRLHDLHLAFKRENLPKALSQHPEMAEFFRNKEYSESNRGPASSKVQQTFIDGRNDPPCPPSPLLNQSPLERFFDPFDPMSVYQLWRSDETKPQTWGYQERVELKTYSIIFMFYGTGTIKIIVSNSDHPFDYSDLVQCVNTIDGYFRARTGIWFQDIAPLFYLEKCHINTDENAGSQEEFSSMGRFNYTINDIQGYMARKYEKVIDGQPLIRSEVCHEHGNYDSTPIDRAFESFRAASQGGVAVSRLVTHQYLQQKSIDALTDDVRGTNHAVRQLAAVVKAQIEKDTRKERPVEKEAELPPEQQSKPKPKQRHPTEVAGFVSAADFSQSSRLTTEEIAQVRASSNELVQRKLSKQEQDIKKRGR
jgi:hypothetical protein